jgi:hypothetical protein
MAEIFDVGAAAQGIVDDERKALSGDAQALNDVMTFYSNLSDKPEELRATNKAVSGLLKPGVESSNPNLDLCGNLRSLEFHNFTASKFIDFTIDSVGLYSPPSCDIKTIGVIHE